MKEKHARHPYLQEVREMIRDSNKSIEGVIDESNGEVVKKAVQRVKDVIERGTVRDERNDPEQNVYSYIISRIIVSVIGDRTLINRYGQSEAKRSLKRFREVGEYTRKRKGGPVIEIELLYDEFEFVYPPMKMNEPFEGGYEVHVTDYLRFAPDEIGWDLKSRHIIHGAVPVKESELYDLLEQAVKERIISDMPLDVPEEVVSLLEDEIEEIRLLIGDWKQGEGGREFVPSLFPECMKDIHNNIEQGIEGQKEVYPYRSASLFAFLNHAGITKEDLYKNIPEVENNAVLKAQAERIFDGGITLPGCDALAGLEICDPEELPEGSHFVDMYRSRVDDAKSTDVEEVTS